MVTEGYRGSPPLPPTPPAKTCQPGRNLGNLGGTLRSMGFRLFLRYVCVFVRLLAFLLACWANIASSRANIARRWPHLAPKTDQHSPKTTQHSPKMGQHSPKMDQHSLKDGPTWRQHACETLQIHGFPMVFAFRLFLGQHRAKIGQHMFKMGRHGSNMGQHRVQIGPTWPSRCDPAPYVGQHGPHTWANLASKRPPTLGGTWGRTLRSMGFRLFCGMFVVVCFFVRLLAFLARMLGQHSLKPGQHSPKMAQPTAHDGPT